MVVLVYCVEEFTNVQVLIFDQNSKTQRNKPVKILGSNN